MEHQLVGVGLLGLVVLELSGELASDGTLLRLEETLQEHADGQINIIGPHIITQMHLSVCLSHSQH